MAGDSRLAIFGGARAVQSDPGDIFTWPIIAQEDEEAVLEVLRRHRAPSRRCACLAKQGTPGRR
jgi:hypothetical protein